MLYSTFHISIVHFLLPSFTPSLFSFSFFHHTILLCFPPSLHFFSFCLLPSFPSFLLFILYSFFFLRGISHFILCKLREIKRGIVLCSGNNVPPSGNGRYCHLTYIATENTGLSSIWFVTVGYIAVGIPGQKNL